MKIKTNEEWGRHVEHCVFCEHFSTAEEKAIVERIDIHKINSTICGKCRFVLSLLGRQVGTEVLKFTYYDPKNAPYTIDRLRGLMHAVHLQSKDALRHIFLKLPASERLAKTYRRHFLNQNQSE